MCLQRLLQTKPPNEYKLCNVSANPLQGCLQWLVGGSFRTPPHLAEKRRNERTETRVKTNDSLGSRCFQKWACERDDVEVSPSLFADPRRVTSHTSTTIDLRRWRKVRRDTARNGRPTPITGEKR